LHLLVFAIRAFSCRTMSGGAESTVYHDTRLVGSSVAHYKSIVCSSVGPVPLPGKA
jgi:hypothetical protein